MKYWRLLVWFPQFGIAAASPIVLFLIFGIWLQNEFDLGVWVICVCILFGIYAGFIGAKDTLRAIKDIEKPTTKPVSFNDHV